MVRRVKRAFSALPPRAFLPVQRCLLEWMVTAVIWWVGVGVGVGVGKTPRFPSLFPVIVSGVKVLRPFRESLSAYSVLLESCRLDAIQPRWGIALAASAASFFASICPSKVTSPEVHTR